MGAKRRSSHTCCAKGAEDMEAMAPDEAAEILRHIKERNAGRILDAMEPRKRTLVHQELQERKY